MPVDDRVFEARAAALQAAAVLHGPLVLLPGVDRAVTEYATQLAIRRLADQLAAYLLGTARLHLIPGPVVDEAEDVPIGTPTHQEDVAMTQLNTGQKFRVTVDTEDAAGYDTAETIEWSIDNGDVATLIVSEDTRSVEVVSGAPGSAVLTASITSLDPPLSATLAVDVVPAGTATIELVAGDVVDE